MIELDKNSWTGFEHMSPRYWCSALSYDMIWIGCNKGHLYNVTISHGSSQNCDDLEQHTEVLFQVYCCCRQCYLKETDINIRESNMCSSKCLIFIWIVYLYHKLKFINLNVFSPGGPSPGRQRPCWRPPCFSSSVSLSLMSKLSSSGHIMISWSRVSTTHS